MKRKTRTNVQSKSDSLRGNTNTTLRKTRCWKSGSDNGTKNPVVVLTRLPEHKVRALRPPKPPRRSSEDESPGSSGSDAEGEAGNGSDSDYSVSNDQPKTVKRRKSETIRARAASTSSSSGELSHIPTTNKEKKGTKAMAIKAFDPVVNVRPGWPEEHVKVDTVVLARRRTMMWQRGKIVEIVTKEDGRLKYKVSFEGSGKSLVSGHHVAFAHTPLLEQLSVGARVVIQCQTNKHLFRPGILAELPGRKNRLRFLVFMDDHTPAYVSLPFLHLVFQPLEDVLENLTDDRHKSFVKRYLKDWPFPHSTQYTVGQPVHAELNGVQQRGRVQVVDSSLIQVLFQESQHSEWIYSGSVRLQQHMARILERKE